MSPPAPEPSIGDQLHTAPFGKRNDDAARRIWKTIEIVGGGYARIASPILDAVSSAECNNYFVNAGYDRS